MFSYCEICLNGVSRQGNEIKSCVDCRCRFHIACFKSLTSRPHCQSCAAKLEPRPCMLCGQLELPVKAAVLQGQLVSYHIFCLVLSRHCYYQQGEVLPTDSLLQVLNPEASCH